MYHYICTGGCKGKSDKPGVCGAETCPKHGTALTPCDCTDGQHYGSLDQDLPAKSSTGETAPQA
jgi:hypothetical protein